MSKKSKIKGNASGKRLFGAAVATAGLAISSASSAGASHPFRIDVDPFAGNPAGLQVSDKSVIDLVNNMIEGQDQFAALMTAPAFTSSLTYWGERNAVLFNFTETPGTVTANLTSGLTDLSVSFTGATRDDVSNQIEDWLEENGADEVRKLNEAISRRSAAAPNDGNPFATTAEVADGSFGRYASGRDARSEVLAETANFTFGLGTALGYQRGTAQTSIGDLDIDKLSVPLDFSFGIRNVGIDVSIPLSYTLIEETAIFGAGVMIGVPVSILDYDNDSVWKWSVTPVGGVMGRVSPDGADGAFIYSGAVANRVEYRINESWRVGLGSQLSAFQDMGLTIAGIDTDRGIDQWMVKNGVNVSRDINRWTLEAHITDSRFLKAAAVQNFQTYGGAVLRNLGKTFFVGLGVDYITGKNFDAIGVGLNTSFNF